MIEIRRLNNYAVQNSLEHLVKTAREKEKGNNIQRGKNTCSINSVSFRQDYMKTAIY